MLPLPGACTPHRENGFPEDYLSQRRGVKKSTVAMGRGSGYNPIRAVGLQDAQSRVVWTASLRREEGPFFRLYGRMKMAKNNLTKAARWRGAFAMIMLAAALASWPAPAGANAMP